MAALIRTASPALKAALASGVKLYAADMFTFTLVDNTVLAWTSWTRDLTWDAITYLSRNPWIKRSTWNVTNTMEVPSMVVTLLALNTSFNGGAQIKLQVHNGLFDGAIFYMQRAFMLNPGDLTALGTVGLFGGKVGGIEINGNSAKLTCKGKINDLDQFDPRNIFQKACLHAFCDPGCTLSRASFTTTKTVGVAPTRSFIPWPGAPPGNAANYQFGTITFTSGSSSGQTRTVAAADNTGLTLSYPLYQLPLAGDTYSAFEGCDYTFNSGSGQSCTARSNQVNFRGYEFIPPPNSAY